MKLNLNNRLNRVPLSKYNIFNNIFTYLYNMKKKIDNLVGYPRKEIFQNCLRQIQYQASHLENQPFPQSR